MSEQPRRSWYRNVCEKHFPVQHPENCTHDQSWECHIAAKIHDLIFNDQDDQHDDEREEE